jgi:hypothetical protein
MPPPAPEEPLIQKYEQEMDANPSEVFAIARRGADKLARRPELVRRLFEAAARRQQERVAQLSKDRVAELADVYAKMLDNRAAALQVRRLWLTKREEALGAGDAQGRVELAQLVLDWCNDQPWAARLCIRAYRLEPDATDAAQFLRTKLDYRLTEDGWVPRKAQRAADREPSPRQIETGMTPAQVRKILGEPKRIARQVLYRRYLEQWIYEDPAHTVVEFDCVKGRPSRVINRLPP